MWSNRCERRTLESRRRAVVSGVQAVDSFNEQIVTLITGEGALTILGENLHVSHLTLEDGRLLLLRTPGTSRLHGVYFWREIASASKCF